MRAEDLVRHSRPRGRVFLVSTKNRDLWEGLTPEVTLGMLNIKSDSLIGRKYEINAMRMLRKLDLPRGRDSWC